ncbi:MAG: formylmethanofuran dehydrogenase subunit A [Candidatus Hydrothermarchaeales archaeon]
MESIVKNGIVFDPLNSIKGEKKDICINDGKIVEKVNERKAKIIDAQNMVVMPGGIDIHSHISGGKVNSGRLFRPEDSLRYILPKTGVTRSGSGFSVTSTFMTGYLYARMGYTTVMSPAMPPLMGRHTHEELNDTPMIDKATYPLFDGNWFVMNYLKNGEIEKCAAYAAWLLRSVKGYTIKIVNPCGTEAWGWGRNITDIDERVPYFDVSPRDMIKGLSEVNEMLGLPHSIHLHPNNLGRPGNYTTTLDSFNVLNGKQSKEERQILHIAHAQFHSYGGDSWKDFESKSEDIAKDTNKKDNTTVDLGLVTLDETTTMTADGPMEYYLSSLTPLKWVNRDVELETAPGITPFVYSSKVSVHSIQWATGLELALLIKDPMKVLLSTDHPNGGPFFRYPRLITWLMSKKYRDEKIDKIHKAVNKRATLSSIDREYDFYEIAAITRAAEAKALGLSKTKGHLGVGADADVAIYDMNPEEIDPSRDYKEIEEKFSKAKYTIKDGTVVVKDGEIVKSVQGKTHWVNAKVDEDLEKEMMKDVEYNFKRFYTVNLGNYPIPESYLTRSGRIDIDATHVS